MKNKAIRGVVAPTHQNILINQPVINSIIFNQPQRTVSNHNYRFPIFTTSTTIATAQPSASKGKSVAAASVAQILHSGLLPSSSAALTTSSSSVNLTSSQHKDTTSSSSAPTQSSSASSASTQTASASSAPTTTSEAVGPTPSSQALPLASIDVNAQAKQKPAGAKQVKKIGRKDAKQTRKCINAKSFFTE